MKRTPPPKPPKGRKRSAIERRVDACNKVMRKFERKRFSFRAGRDCGQMFAFHAGQLGHRINVGKAGSYVDAAGALAALQRYGVDTLPALVDQFGFERIGHAYALPGDVMQLPVEAGPFAEIGALVIWLGDGAIFGYHDDAERAVAMKLVTEPLACWRMLP